MYNSSDLYDIEPGASNIESARHTILSPPETRYGTSKGHILEPVSDIITTTNPARNTIRNETSDMPWNQEGTQYCPNKGHDMELVGDAMRSHKWHNREQVKERTWIIRQ